MSTDDGDDDGGQNSAPPWFLDPVADTAVLVALVIAAGLIFCLVRKLVKPPYIRWRDRRAQSRKPADDCFELVERQETVEDPRRSEESIGSRCEFEKPVENNAKLEV